MSETITITLEVNNRTELENLARDKGYATVQAYLLALIAADQNTEDNEPLTPAERFRAGWRDVLDGNEGIPYDEMWDEIDDASKN